jgi:co-chaperonin GroES (HSP10)
MKDTDALRPLISAEEIIPIGNDVLIYDLFFGEQITNAGVIILDDDKKDRGIHPRWAKVYAVGPKNNSEIKPEQWVLIEHGRWSRGFDLPSGITVRRADPKALLMVSDVDPNPKNACFVRESIT